jgi:hypothetical protein
LSYCQRRRKIYLQYHRKQRQRRSHLKLQREAIIEPLSVPDKVVVEEAVGERKWRIQFHRDQPQIRVVVDRVEKILLVSVFSSYRILEGVVLERMEDLLSSRELDNSLQ